MTMKRALLMVSSVALLAIVAASVGQALLVAWNVTFTPQGQPVDPNAPALVATYLGGLGGVLSVPLCLVAFTLGVIVLAMRQRYVRLVALLAVGALALAGLFGMALLLLSARSPVAFVAPLAAVPVVTLLSCLGADQSRASGLAAQ